MKSLFLTILISLLALTALAQEYEKSRAIDAGIIIVGMTKEEVIEAIGEPFYKSRYKNMSVWWYPDRKFIYFRDGRVTEATFPVRAPKYEL